MGDPRDIIILYPCMGDPWATTDQAQRTHGRLMDHRRTVPYTWNVLTNSFGQRAPRQEDDGVSRANSGPVSGI